MKRNEIVAGVAEAVPALVHAAHRGMAEAYDVVRIDLLELAARSEVRPAEIGAALGLLPSAVTRHVQALQDAGHLDVRRDPDDARTCLLSTTAAGRAEVEQIREIGAAMFAQVMADWSDADIATLARLADRLRTDWAAHGPQARRRTAPSPRPRWRHEPDAQPSKEES